MYATIFQRDELRSIFLIYCETYSISAAGILFFSFDFRLQEDGEWSAGTISTEQMTC